MFKLLEQSFHVDDLLMGDSNNEKALAIYHRVKKLMAEGGFNLRKWKANSIELQRAIAETENVTKSIGASSDNKEDNESYVKPNSQGLSTSTPINEDIFVKVLGMNWNTLEDETIFSFVELYKYVSSLPLTKRSVLKVTAKIYDPMGFLLPLTVEMEILFQELCIEKTNWDTELKGESLRKWKLFLQDLILINCCHIPRCYFARQPVDTQLHGFSDASEHAYATVVYIQSTYLDGQVEVQLVTSKSRVAPIKKQTIPRLELLGALILAQLVNNLKSQVDIESPAVSGLEIATDTSTFATKIFAFATEISRQVANLRPVCCRSFGHMLATGDYFKPKLIKEYHIEESFVLFINKKSKSSGKIMLNLP